MTRTIIVYGNCQAGVFADALKHFVGEDCDVAYLESFQASSGLRRKLEDVQLARCVLVFAQIDKKNPLPLAVIQGLPPHVKIIRFPPLDLNLLWPFNCADPRNKEELPDYPFGRYPYGDRIVVSLLKAGLSGHTLWTEYKRQSVEILSRIDRLKKYEIHRLNDREKFADIYVGSYVIDNYAKRQLFWTPDHPTSNLLNLLFKEMLKFVQPVLSLTDAIFTKADELFREYDPFSDQHQPIHPDLARELGLEWVKPDITYRYFGGRYFSFEEYMLRYIEFQ